MKNIVKSDHAQNTAQSNRAKSNKKKSKNKFIKWLAKRWNKIKSFMKREDASQWTMATLTLVIVVLTIITTYFNCRQINTYEIATKADLRAYLSIKIIPDSTHWGAVIVSITNVGKTPAYNVKYFWEYKSGEGGFSQIEFDSLKQDSTFCRNFIGQNVEIPYPINSRVAFRIGELDSIINWKGRGLYYFGKITYKDKFGISHFVNFNVLYHATLNRYIYLKNFNDAD